MVEVYINGQLVESHLEDEKIIGDVLKSFEITCEENNAAVLGITVDGNVITADNFDEEAKKPFGPDSKFEFDVITAYEIKDSFKALSKLFDDLGAQMEAVPLQLQDGKYKEVVEPITKLAEEIQKFVHLTSLASLFPETFTTKTIGDVSFEAFFEEFTPILKDFEDALKNKDFVMIGDLAEYEICPRLQSISETLKNM